MLNQSPGRYLWPFLVLALLIAMPLTFHVNTIAIAMDEASTDAIIDRGMAQYRRKWAYEYHYLVNGNPYRGVETVSILERWRPDGSTTRVYYKKSDPSISSLDDPADYLTKRTVFAGVLIGLGAVVLFFRQCMRSGEADDTF